MKKLITLVIAVLMVSMVVTADTNNNMYGEYGPATCDPFAWADYYGTGEMYGVEKTETKTNSGYLKQYLNFLDESSTRMLEMLNEQDTVVSKIQQTTFKDADRYELVKKLYGQALEMEELYIPTFKAIGFPVDGDMSLVELATQIRTEMENLDKNTNTMAQLLIDKKYLELKTFIKNDYAWQQSRIKSLTEIYFMYYKERNN